MGFEPVVDSDGPASKMLVRTYKAKVSDNNRADNRFSTGSQTGDVHCVSFDNDNTRYDNARLLWKLAAS